MSSERELVERLRDELRMYELCHRCGRVNEHDFDCERAQLGALVRTYLASAEAQPSAVGGNADPPCAGCGGVYQFDTVLPSPTWNAVIRAAGLPDYLCTTCIIAAFVARGESFTATLWGGHFHNVPIEVRVGGDASRDAALLTDENTRLRAALLADDPAVRQTAHAVSCRPPAPAGGDFPEALIRRACEDAKGRAVQAGLPKVALDVSHVEAVLTRLATERARAEELARERDEALQLAGGSEGIGPTSLRDLAGYACEQAMRAVELASRYEGAKAAVRALHSELAHLHALATGADVPEAQDTTEAARAVRALRRELKEANDLVWRAMHNADHPRPDGADRWVYVQYTFAVGSTRAKELCRRFNLDPDASQPREWLDQDDEAPAPEQTEGE